MNKKLLISAVITAVTGLAIPVFAQTAGGITFNPQTVTMSVGDTVKVAVTSPTTFYIGSNANPAVASAAIQSSNSLVVSAYLEGTDSISVCSYGATGGVSCSSLGITVQKKTSASTTTTSSSQAAATLTLSQSQIELNIGDTKNVSANGSAKGYYYVSTVSNPEIAAASVVGGSNQIQVTASSIGGSNVTICQFGGTCTGLYVYVPPSASNLQAAQTVKNPLPLLSSFYVASNDLGGSFLGTGATLTIKFTTSMDVVSEHLTIAGRAVPVTGAGPGPFAGTYVLTGKETLPLEVAIDFTTGAGVTGRSTFTVGGTTVAAASPAIVASPTTGGTAFTKYLSLGSANSEVRALQALLKKLGLFTGKATGSYGPLTESAVKKYQQLRGLDPAGVIGPATRAALNKE